MLILPLIDLLILVGTGCLAMGFALKAIDITTHYRAAILGFTSLDFLLMMAVCWGFALTLTARSWVRINEPLLLERRRQSAQAQARRRVAEYELANGTAGAEEPKDLAAGVASGDPH